MALKLYNPNEVIVSFAGLSITGFTNEDFISVERTTEANSSGVGVGGEVTINISSDNRKTVTLRLQQTSADNALLSGIFNVQRLAGTPLISPIAIKDGLGNELHTAPEAWIMNEPDADFGPEAGQREWVIECANMKSFIGGS